MGDAQPHLVCEPFLGAHHPHPLEDPPGASQLNGTEPQGPWPLPGPLAGQHGVPPAVVALPALEDLGEDVSP